MKNITLCEIGCLILAGGKSSRMGYPKSRLRLHGISFLEMLSYELSGFREFLISVDQAEKHPEITAPTVEDRYPDCGPMSGIYSALCACGSEALLTVPCDVPLFSYGLARQMAEALTEEADALVAVTEDGRMHPLCGIYRKRCIPALEACLQDGNFRMKAALSKLSVQFFQAGKQSFRLQNVNTPEEYAAICRETPGNRNCLAISGYKNSGKTTLCERLIPLLSRRGISVAAIKHDGHRFLPDVPGTDSCRFYEAGAQASLVFDNEKYALTARTPADGSFSLSQAAALCGDAELLLLEGFKGSAVPKLALWRDGIERLPADTLRNCLGCVTNLPKDGAAYRQLQEDMRKAGRVLLDQDRPEEIAAWIAEAVREGRLLTEL